MEGSEVYWGESNIFVCSSVAPSEVLFSVGGNVAPSEMLLSRKVYVVHGEVRLEMCVWMRASLWAPSEIHYWEVGEKLMWVSIENQVELVAETRPAVIRVDVVHRVVLLFDSVTVLFVGMHFLFDDHLLDMEKLFADFGVCEGCRPMLVLGNLV